MRIHERIPGQPHSRTTYAYSAWHMDEIELRSFLLSSAEGMSSWFKAKEDEAEKAVSHLEPEYTYGDEAYNHFMDEVGIFWETYWYQLASAVVKDAFTLFEVFLEESADGILRRYNSHLKKLATEDSWRMNECDQFFNDYLGLPVLNAQIEDVQWIRNKLAHLRDELRTKAGRDDFGERLNRLGVHTDETAEEADLNLSHFEFGRQLAFTKSLVLSPLEAWRILDIIRAHTDELTLVLHSFQYGGLTTAPLQALRRGTPVRSRDARLIQIPETSSQ